jgi:alpha-tubulin suppressor-like RCC1 family protein
MIAELNNIKMLTCGNEHSLALLMNGDIYSWGKAEGGVLGYMEEEIEFTPKRIQSLKNIDKVCSGSLHNIAINSDGECYSWGCGEGGQLGLSEEILVYLT